MSNRSGFWKAFWPALTAVGTCGGIFVGKQSAMIDNSRDNSYGDQANVMYVENAFLGEAIKEGLTESSPEKQEFGEKIVQSFMRADNEGTVAERSRAVGQTIGKLIDEAPISRFQIPSNEFMMKVGDVRTIPGSNNVVAYHGRSGSVSRTIRLTCGGTTRSGLAIGGTMPVARRDEAAGTITLLEITEDFSEITLLYQK